MADATLSPQTRPVLPGAHPPKPVLTLRVGLSGHRPKPDKLPALRITFGLRNAPESWRDYVYWNVKLEDEDT